MQDQLNTRIIRALGQLEGEVKGGRLPIGKITAAVNEEEPEEKRIRPQEIGRRLSIMGFQKATLANGYLAILWDEEKVKRLQQETPEEETSFPSLFSDIDFEKIVGDPPRLPWELVKKAMEEIDKRYIPGTREHIREHHPGLFEEIEEAKAWVSSMYRMFLERTATYEMLTAALKQWFFLYLQAIEVYSICMKG